MRWISLLALCLMLTVVQADETQQPDDDPYILADRLGIAHISTTGRPTDESRYEKALEMGAGWNRWPLYWDRVNAEPDVWDWEIYDRQIMNDLRHNLQLNVILIGVPERERDGDVMRGLYEPIFDDESDIPGEDKALNPANPWVGFVQATVARYKPGGDLAKTGQIPLGTGVQVWEIWNEPDFETFWTGTARDYARLLKISYIVIKQEDPEAQVMFGGLLYPTEDNFMAAVLNIYTGEADRPEDQWYFDIAAVHSYADPWRSGWMVLYVRQTMIAFGFMRPIWLNESGVPVWDDYPGPTWAPDSLNRATVEQQAYYFVQSTALAWIEGADKVFLHQLFDDCGDQPAGTNFEPHDGELCDEEDEDNICFGDAHGAYRNQPDSVCFSNSVLPGTARPLVGAYQLVAEIFGPEPFVPGERLPVGNRFYALSFERPASTERIVVIWNRTTEEQILELPAVAPGGSLYAIDGMTRITADENENYSITLPPAAEDIDTTEDGRPAIGGEPFILVESRG
jgi:hypothetical protein